jgi:hypothetical protein
LIVLHYIAKPIDHRRVQFPPEKVLVSFVPGFVRGEFPPQGFLAFDESSDEIWARLDSILKINIAEMIEGLISNL